MYMAPQLSSSVPPLPPLLLYILSVFSLLLVNVIRVAAFLPSIRGRRRGYAATCS